MKTSGGSKSKYDKNYDKKVSFTQLLMLLQLETVQSKKEKKRLHHEVKRKEIAQQIGNCLHVEFSDKSPTHLFADAYNYYLGDLEI